MTGSVMTSSVMGHRKSSGYASILERQDPRRRRVHAKRGRAEWEACGTQSWRKPKTTTKKTMTTASRARPAPAGAGGGEGGGDRKQKKEKGREEEESSRGKNVISPLFSLLNRLQPVRGVLWSNFTEPECLLANCSKRGVRQQMTITLDVRRTIVP